MHAHDRTMLARLGFADPDKKNPTHDLACQYLALPENGEALLKHVQPERRCRIRLPPKHEEWGYETVPTVLRETALEVPLSKGHGQYKTTIGFIDVVLRFRGSDCVWQTMTLKHVNDTFYCDRHGTSCQASGAVGVEVKTTPIGVGEILRQINLYREYAEGVWVVATTFQLPQLDIDTLCSAAVQHVWLGPKFERWCMERRTAPTREAVQYEI